MARQLSRGQCSFCNGEFAKSSMTRHLNSCKERQSTEPAKGRAYRVFHIIVEGRYQPEYWIHIEARANTTLDELDDFLRETWLECCGHLSAFAIGRGLYMSYADDLDDLDQDMYGVKLGAVLKAPMTIFHKYDFGTTTDLSLRVVAEREVKSRKPDVQMLARNLAPDIRCDECGAVAELVCPVCVWSEEPSWYCGACADDHDCGIDMLLPVVNSPRTGMCGYTGTIDYSSTMLDI